MTLDCPIIITGRAENKTYWIHSGVVKQICGIKDSHMRKNIFQGRNNGLWTSKKVDGAWYIDVNSIPNRAPKFYRSLFPANAELEVKAKMTQSNDTDLDQYLINKLDRLVNERVSQEDVIYYQYTMGYSKDTAIQLAESKSWLEYLAYLSEGRNFISIGIETKMRLYEYATAKLVEKQIKGFKVTTVNSLRNKLASYPKSGDLAAKRNFVTHKGKGNANANIVNRELIVDKNNGLVFNFSLHMTLIYGLYMNVGHGNKQYKIVLHQEYESMLMDLGFTKTVSYSTFCRYTNEFEFKAKSAMETHGKKYFNDKYLPYVSADPLKMKNTLWGGDGSSTKLYFNDGGKARSLMCYRIADIASRKIIGYSLYKGGSSQQGESEEVVLAAINMAYQNTGLFAAELITDNGGCAGTNEFKTKMKMIFGKFTTISPGNSQENPTETIIKSMNNFGRKYKNWGGSSFNATQEENKNNPDYFNIKELPSYEEAIQQAIQWIEEWNNSARLTGMSPNELFESLESNSLAKEPIDQAYRYVFGNEVKQMDLSYQRGFINIEHQGMEHQFTIPNYEDSMQVLSKRTGQKGSIDVMIKWQGNFADIYNKEGEYILTCERTVKTHKSFAEATESSWLDRQEMADRKVQVVESARKLVTDVSEAMNYLNTARTSNAPVKDTYNEQMEEKFNQRIEDEKIELPKDRTTKKKDAVMDLI